MNKAPVALHHKESYRFHPHPSREGRLNDFKGWLDCGVYKAKVLAIQRLTPQTGTN